MRARRSAPAALALALATALPVAAAPVHVLAARPPAPQARAAAVAIDPRLTVEEQATLAQALTRWGFMVAPPGGAAAQEVTLRAASRPLCTSACSALTGYNVGPLADHFRHVVVVAARPSASRSAATPLSWYVKLQSDGLSNREGDYLPAMLDYGARVFRPTAG